MNDVAITIAQTAHWLNCSADEAQAHLDAGRIRPYDGRGRDPSKPVSLNSVVIYAESLPDEAGIFRVRDGAGAADRADRPDRGSDRATMPTRAGTGSGAYTSERRAGGARTTPVIVERRTILRSVGS
ncbi:MAG TPA: hypothetical protein VEY95_05100 [Azospirillaceae bacterium]|nr:hypothetical protein [Azospirillaceae bacterium]